MVFGYVQPLLSISMATMSDLLFEIYMGDDLKSAISQGFCHSYDANARIPNVHLYLYFKSEGCSRASLHSNPTLIFQTWAL